MIEAHRLIGAGMTCVVTNAAHIVLCSCSLFFTLSLSWLLALLPDAPPSPSPHLYHTSLFHSFSLYTFFSPILLLPLSHPVFPSRSSHLLYQRLCTHTFLLPSSHPSLSLYLFFVPLSFCFLSHSHLYTLFSLPTPAPPVSLWLLVISQVDWPLNIIITDSCMNKYNRLFSFLLQLKHMVWSLREVWFHLKRTGETAWAFDPGRAQTPPLREKS